MSDTREEGRGRERTEDSGRVEREPLTEDFHGTHFSSKLFIMKR
jgi:hypothetical protein